MRRIKKFVLSLLRYFNLAKIFWNDKSKFFLLGSYGIKYVYLQPQRFIRNANFRQSNMAQVRIYYESIKDQHGRIMDQHGLKNIILPHLREKLPRESQ